MLYLVCFDISDNKTRTRIGNYLGAFGNRVKESVFEVELADAQGGASPYAAAAVLDHCRLERAVVHGRAGGGAVENEQVARIRRVDRSLDRS